MNEVATRPMKNPQLLDRLIAHYKTCSSDEIDWGTENCIAGMLCKWGIAVGEHGMGNGIRGIMDTFDLFYSDAEALFSARLPESQARMFADPHGSNYWSGPNFFPWSLALNHEKRAAIVACLEHMKTTGKPLWAMPSSV
jgi:hypothetical protein